MSTVFDFAAPNFVTLSLKSAVGLLLNVYSLTLGITSDKGLVAFYSLWNEFPEHSLTNGLSVPQIVGNFRVHHFSCIKSDKIWSCLLEWVDDIALTDKIWECL